MTIEPSTEPHQTLRDEALPEETQLVLDLGRPFRSPALAAAGEPDLALEDPTEHRHAFRLGDGNQLVMTKERFEAFREYQRMVYALWNSVGRLELTSDELLERAETYRGSQTWQDRAGRRIYRFDLSDDVGQFLVPFGDGEMIVLPEDLKQVQLTFDGRAVENVGAGALGVRQEEILSVLKYRPGLTSTQAGVLSHALHASCPEYQRQDRYRSDYHGSACCRKAVDVGSDLMGIMARQGRVWNDDGIWRTYPETTEWSA